MPEPQRFHIGLIDLFSVWLPGAVLTYVFKDQFPSHLGLPLPQSRESVEAWVVFLVVSYIAGHLLFVAGSVLFDPIDNRIRKAGRDQWLKQSGQSTDPAPAVSARERQVKGWTDWHKKRRLSRLRTAFWKPLQPLLARLSLLLFDEEDWAALDSVLACKGERLNAMDAAPAINAFQWSKARLALGHSDALAMVQRFEADSKFFRSLCAALSVLAASGAATCNTFLWVSSLVLLPLAFSRFLGLRAKSTSQAYWLIIVLETTPPAERAAPARDDDA